MLRDAFERVAVLNLDRRLDRWNSFRQRIPSNWPFRDPVRFEAIDGQLCTAPSWWHSGGGAWGCYRSHLSIIEDCLNRGIGSVLLIEDDATFVDGFAEQARLFFEHLPPDWAFVYLGGQHIHEDLRLPRRINDWVYRPFNVNRTHCFGIRGRQMLELVYRHLNAIPDWNTVHHIDHYLGELHKQFKGGLYAPRQWLVGQVEGYSNITDKEWPTLFFRGAESLTTAKIDLPMVAVLGPYMSGASCVAGMLHHLGVNMGGTLPAPTKTDPLGSYEAEGLGKFCRMAFLEPWLVEDVFPEDRVNLLHRWAGDRCAKLRGTTSFSGGNHPLLCLMGPELLQAWRDPFFVVVDRPIQDSIHAIQRDAQHWNWPKEAVRYAVPFMAEKREAFLRDHGPRHMRVALNRLKSCPGQVLDEVCQQLCYEPNDEQRKQALSFVAEWFAKQDPANAIADRRSIDNDKNKLKTPFVACLGLHRSGSSCVAGVLHRLGVHMGNRFVGCEADGGYEAEGIASICERYMPFPEIETKLDDQATKQMLSAWIHEKAAEASAKGTIAGAKYPHLSAMGEMLMEAWKNAVYIVNCERPLEESIASLIRRDGKRLDRKRLEMVQRYLWQRKSSFLSTPGLKVHTVDYHALLQNPEVEVRKLAHFLPLEINESRIREAAAYVKPEKRHIALVG